MADAVAKDEVQTDPLDRVLALAKAERDARNSPQWKFNLEGAVEKHGEIVDRLYDELYRQLDERASAGQPVSKWTPPPDAAEELKKRLTRALKSELPAMIADMVDTIIDQEK